MRQKLVLHLEFGHFQTVGWAFSLLAARSGA
jgi:hypothetical protein